MNRRLRIFFRLLDLGSRLRPPAPGTVRDLGPVHLRFTGEGGGDLTLQLAGGRLRIAAGIPRSPASAATMSRSTWLDLVAGRTTFPTAQMTGKVHVDGDPTAGFLLVAVLARWHQATAAEGAGGRASRALQRWLLEGASP